MSEVELQAIYSKFDTAKTEYNTLLSEINTTTCLGTVSNTLADKCATATELIATMQSSIIQMSNFFKPSNEQNDKNQQKFLQISKQLQKDNAHLKVLDTNKALVKDNQVMSTMNYHQALIWLIACITIVLLIYNQSLILFFACITLVFLLYHQLWFLSCIAAGLLYFYLTY